MARRRLPEGSFLDPIWGAQQKGLTIAGKGWKMVGDKLAPPVERQNLATDVSSGIGQLSGQIGLALLSGGVSSVTSMGTMLAQGADVMGRKIAKDQDTSGWFADASQNTRDLATVAGAVITPLTERYGLDKLLNRVPPAIKNRFLRFVADKAAAGGIEAAQELTDGTIAQAAQAALHNDERAETLRLELRQLKRLAAIVSPHLQQAKAEDRAGALNALASIPPVAFFRDVARGRVGQMPVVRIPT